MLALGEPDGLLTIAGEGEAIAVKRQVLRVHVEPVVVIINEQDQAL